MEKQKKGLTEVLTTYVATYGLATIIAIIGFIITYQFVGPPPPRMITIATGAEQGAYFHFGHKYAEWLKRHKITLNVLTTAGSTENLQLLESAKADVAFVQGGTTTDEQGLLSLGSVYHEPLWVFYRAQAPIRYLSDLKGKPVAFGAKCSGTRAVAMLLAKENGLDPDAHPTVNQLSAAEAAEALKSGKVDAAFFITSPKAPVIRDLLGNPNTPLLSIVRTEAYTRRHRFLDQLAIPQGMLDMEQNIPTAPVHLVSPTANLVVREDLHPALVDLLLQAAADTHQKGSMFDTPGQYPTDESLVFPLSPDAARYYKLGPPFLQRYLPFWIATMIDRLKVLVLPFLVLLIPLAKVVPPTFRWRIRRSIIRWYKEIQAVDIALDEADAKAQLDELAERMDRVEHEVTLLQVPLGYVDQVYNLRLHIGLIREKLERLK